MWLVSDINLILNRAKLQDFWYLAALCFSTPTERAAIATGNDLRGLGICHQQAFSRNSGNGISAKYAILRKIALLASSFRNLAKNGILILFGQPPIMYSEYFVGGLLCLNI